jgi:hypothetical protein
MYVSVSGGSESPEPYEDAAFLVQASAHLTRPNVQCLYPNRIDTIQMVHKLDVINCS